MSDFEGDFHGVFSEILAVQLEHQVYHNLVFFAVDELCCPIFDDKITTGFDVLKQTIIRVSRLFKRMCAIIDDDVKRTVFCTDFH